MRDIDSVTWGRISKFSHVEYELQRTIVSDCTNGRRRDCGGHLLIFVVQPGVRFRTTYLTEHFCEYLGCMAIYSFFVVFFCMLFPFCLSVRNVGSRGTSTDKSIASRLLCR